MKLILNKLTIRNFKGFKSYELDANGEDINVFGDNATGKTSLYDAFLWCLFGKNSADQATFDWKPLDKNGNEIHHLETEVAVELDINGKLTKLSRMIEERWTKKRGSATETFSGHTTTFKIDDLTVKKKDYEDSLNELISEDLFKLLTNVSYFPEKMKWQERRQTLIDMVGDVTDADVIDSNAELEPLKELIEERPAAELKQLTEQQMKQINKDIKALPDRIDEVERGLPDISKLDKDELLKEKVELENKIGNLQEDVVEAKNSDATIKLKNQIAELRTHYRELELEHQEELAEELSGFEDELESMEENLRRENDAISDLQYEIKDRERKVRNNKEEVHEMEADQEKLRAQFYDIQQEQKESFDAHRTTCPTCDQDLPEEQILKVRNDYEKEVEAFNADKAKRLKENVQKGKELSEKIQKLEQENKAIGDNLTELTKRLSEKEEFKEVFGQDIKSQEKAIGKIRAGQNPFSETEKAKEIMDEVAELQEQIDSGQSTVDEDVEEINKEIKKVRTELSEVNEHINNINFHARQSERKNELIEREQTLSIEYGQLEQRLYLLEEFTRTKVNLLTDTINDRFKLVKFKLFEEQINSGLNETCEVTVNGANYSTGLNNAMRINAGLDIINTLMDYYDAYVPVFVDNAESVNDLLEIDTQLITLSVSNHKNLRVEVA